MFPFPDEDPADDPVSPIQSGRLSIHVHLPARIVEVTEHQHTGGVCMDVNNHFVRLIPPDYGRRVEALLLRTILILCWQCILKDHSTPEVKTKPPRQGLSLFVRIGIPDPVHNKGTRKHLWVLVYIHLVVVD